MRQRFIRTTTNNPIDGKLSLCEKKLWLFTVTPTKTEKKKTILHANGMHDETSIAIPNKNFTFLLTGLTTLGERNTQPIINRSGGNMLTPNQEHLYSRIPELFETLPLKVWQLQHNPN